MANKGPDPDQSGWDYSAPANLKVRLTQGMKTSQSMSWTDLLLPGNRFAPVRVAFLDPSPYFLLARLLEPLFSSWLSLLWGRSGGIGLVIAAFAR